MTKSRILGWEFPRLSGGPHTVTQSQVLTKERQIRAERKCYVTSSEDGGRDPEPKKTGGL